MRVVLDTNVVVSAMIFPRGHLTWLRESWSKGQIFPLIDKPCVEELLRVLAYPKFHLAPDDIQTLLGAYLPFTETVGAASTKIAAKLPHCSDPHDQKFLILAEMGKADALVTGDRALLALAGQTRFAIETPSMFRQRIGR